MSNQFATAAKKQKKSTAPTRTDTSTTANKPSSRIGAKHIGGYFTPEVAKQLKQIALEEDTSIQHLLAEGIDMVFHSRKKPTIANTKS